MRPPLPQGWWDLHWCGRWDLNPHGPFQPYGFSYHFGFRRRQLARGSWSGLSLHHYAGVIRRFRCCPSSLYTFPCSGLGSGLPRIEVSPTLSSSASPVSQASTQVFLKSAAYAIPPRPRAAVLIMIGHVARFYTSVSLSGGCGEACVFRMAFLLSCFSWAA